MSYAVVLTTEPSPVEPASATGAGSDARPTGTQLVRDTVTGETSAWAVHERESLPPGSRVTGPAIIAENETSTMIGAGWRGLINSLGYIEMMRETGNDG